MCIDDGCDELLCCLCAPLAAIFCCKICKDKMGSNNVNQAPDSSYFQQPDGRVPVSGVYGPQGYGPPRNQVRFYPGGPQPQYPTEHQLYQETYHLPRQGYGRQELPPVMVRQQPRPY